MLSPGLGQGETLKALDIYFSTTRYGGVELVTWGGLTGGEGSSRPIITMEDTDTEDEEGQQVS